MLIIKRTWLWTYFEFRLLAGNILLYIWAIKRPVKRPWPNASAHVHLVRQFLVEFFQLDKALIDASQLRVKHGKVQISRFFDTRLQGVFIPKQPQFVVMCAGTELQRNPT